MENIEKQYQTGPIEYFLKQISMLDHFRDKKKERFNELTERETEILGLIASGMKNPAIAEYLGISRTTVQNHRAQIRDKLNIIHQADYIKYAMAFDLIQF